MITILNRKMYRSTGNLRRPIQKHRCPTLYQICPSQDHMLVPALILNLDNFLVLVPCINDCSCHLKVFPQMNVSWEFQYESKNRFYTKKKLRCVRLSISLPYLGQVRIWIMSDKKVGHQVNSKEILIYTK